MKTWQIIAFFFVKMPNFPTERVSYMVFRNSLWEPEIIFANYNPSNERWIFFST